MSPDIGLLAAALVLVGISAAGAALDKRRRR
jgi:hypothetical protein